jgi:hypothetical protein
LGDGGLPYWPFTVFKDLVGLSRESVRTKFLVIGAVLALICACSSSSPPDTERMRQEASSLRATFGEIETADVLVYRNQDWCKLLEYPRGAYASDQAQTCTLYPRTWQPFDQQADADFGTISRALGQAIVHVRMIEGVAYDTDGTIVSISFELEGYFSKPGYVRFNFERDGSMPSDDSELTNTRIDDQSYLQFEDWM